MSTAFRFHAYILSILLVFVCVGPVFADANLNINVDNNPNQKTSGDIMEQVNAAGGKAGLTNEDPRLFIAAGIKVLLGITGTLFFALIVFAGYVRLTAQGDEDRVKKSNNTAVAALLGLGIVVLAYAITVFVTTRLYNVATYEEVYDENNAAPNTTYEKSINIELF